jgi:hypothetical protein
MCVLICRVLLQMRCCVAALWLSALTGLAAAAADEAHHELAPAQVITPPPPLGLCMRKGPKAAKPN